MQEVYCYNIMAPHILRELRGSPTDDSRTLQRKNAAALYYLESFESFYHGRHFEHRISLLDTRRIESVWKFVPSVVFSSAWIRSPRALEQISVFWWIARDMVLLLHPLTRFSVAIGVSLSTISAIWSTCQLFQAMTFKNFPELCHSLSRLIWQLAVSIWFYSAITASVYNSHCIFISNVSKCFAVLIAALSMEVITLFIVFPLFKSRPIEITTSSFPLPDWTKSLTSFDEPRLHNATWFLRCPLLPLFEKCTWRDIECAQLLLFIAKDLVFLSSSSPDSSMYACIATVSCILPLLLVNTTLNIRRVLVDHVHYLALLLWVVGSSLAQSSYLLCAVDSTLATSQRVLLLSIAAAIMIAALMLLMLFYMVWIWVSSTGAIAAANAEEKAGELLHDESVSVFSDRVSADAFYRNEKKRQGESYDCYIIHEPFNGDFSRGSEQVEGGTEDVAEISRLRRLLSCVTEVGSGVEVGIASSIRSVKEPRSQGRGEAQRQTCKRGQATGRELQASGAPWEERHSMSVNVRSTGTALHMKTVEESFGDSISDSDSHDGRSRKTSSNNWESGIIRKGSFLYDDMYFVETKEEEAPFVPAAAAAASPSFTSATTPTATLTASTTFVPSSVASLLWQPQDVEAGERGCPPTTALTTPCLDPIKVVYSRPRRRVRQHNMSHKEEEWTDMSTHVDKREEESPPRRPRHKFISLLDDSTAEINAMDRSMHCKEHVNTAAQAAAVAVRRGQSNTTAAETLLEMDDDEEEGDEDIEGVITSHRNHEDIDTFPSKGPSRPLQQSMQPSRPIPHVPVLNLVEAFSITTCPHLPAASATIAEAAGAATTRFSHTSALTIDTNHDAPDDFHSPHPLIRPQRHADRTSRGSTTMRHISRLSRLIDTTVTTPTAVSFVTASSPHRQVSFRFTPRHCHLHNNMCNVSSPVQSENQLMSRTTATNSAIHPPSLSPSSFLNASQVPIGTAAKTAPISPPAVRIRKLRTHKKAASFDGFGGFYHESSRPQRLEQRPGVRREAWTDTASSSTALQIQESHHAPQQQDAEIITVRRFPFISIVGNRAKFSSRDTAAHETRNLREHSWLKDGNDIPSKDEGYIAACSSPHSSERIFFAAALGNSDNLSAGSAGKDHCDGEARGVRDDRCSCYSAVSDESSGFIKRRAS